MTNHDHLADAAPYVLDALDDIQRARFERHLDGCEECRGEVASLRQGLEADAIAHRIDPPAHLRSAVLGQLESTPQAGHSRRSRSWGLPAAAAVAALVVAVGALLVSGGQPSLEDLLARSDTSVAALDGTEAYGGPGSGDVIVSADGATVYVRFENLEANAAGSTYEAWIIDPALGASPAGLFSPDAEGAAVLRLDGRSSDGLLVGITIEPAGGSPQPTGDVLFLGEL